MYNLCAFLGSFINNENILKKVKIGRRQRLTLEKAEEIEVRSERIFALAALSKGIKLWHEVPIIGGRRADFFAQNPLSKRLEKKIRVEGKLIEACKTPVERLAKPDENGEYDVRNVKPNSGKGKQVRTMRGYHGGFSLLLGENIDLIEEAMSRRTSCDILIQEDDRQPNSSVRD